eukprot:9475971-Pyramimonas_sp.AAC.1
MRKALANISASSFGNVVLMDMSHQTVCRSEISFGSRLQSSFRTFHIENEADMLQQAADSLSSCVDADPTHRYISTMSVHRFRADATNSSIWNGNKLMVSELESIYVSSDLLSRPNDEVRHLMMNESQSMRRVLDMLPIIDASGKGTYCTVRKVCETAGFRWTSFVTPAPAPLPPALQWRVVMYISDGGPDQVGREGQKMKE